MIAQWGVMLPNFNPFGLDPWPFLEVARAVEHAEFDAGWVGDHLAFHPPIMEATVALGAAAVVTTRMKLGFAVLLAAMRQPVWLAKAIATIDQLAPGRVVVGVGAGGEHEPEWRAAGADVAGRGGRLDELLSVLPALLAGERVDHIGARLNVHTPPLRPAVSVMPPVVVGGRSDAAVRRAARFGDGWLGVWLSPAGFKRSCDELQTFAQEFGRPCPEPMLLAFVAIGDDSVSCREDATRFYRAQYNLDYRAVERWTLTGSVEAVADCLTAYREAGAQSIALVPARPALLEQVEQMAEVRQRVETQS